MNSNRIDIVAIRLDHPLQQTVLDAQDHRELRPRVQLHRAQTRVIDILYGVEFCRRSHPMRLGRFQYDPGRWSTRDLGRSPHERIEQVDHVEVA